MFKNLSLYFLLIIALSIGCKRQIHKSTAKESANMMELQMKAMKAQQSGDNKTALRYFNIVINRYPDSPDGYSGRARVKEKIEDYEGAIRDIDKALSLLPSNSKKYVERGDYFSFRGDCNKSAKKDEEATGDYNQAIIAYENGVKNNAGDDRVLEHKSLLEERLKNYDAAIADIIAAIKYNPQQVFYYYELANLKNKTGDYKGSISTSNQAIKLESRSGLPYFDLGYAYYQLKDYQAAINNFDKYIAVYPKIYEAFYYRGLAKFYLDQKAEACIDWHNAAANGYNKADSLIKVNCK